MELLNVIELTPPLTAWIPAAIAAGAALVGGSINNKANAKEAAKNRDFQQQNSDTAYQRAKLDMKRAGLNPILASKMGGASTPGGAMAQMQDVVTPAVSSALQTSQTEAGLEKTKQEVKNLAVSENLTEKQITHVSATIEHIREQIKKVAQDRDLSFQNTMSKNYQNIADSIITQYFQENPKSLIAKELGIGEGVTNTIIRSVIMGGAAVSDDLGKASDKIQSFRKHINSKYGNYHE
jgi:DNA-binding protein H-NS